MLGTAVNRFASIFQAAIRYHEICCRLTKTVDRIASFFFGTTLIVAVPWFTIIVSNLDKFSRDSSSLRQTLMNLTYLVCAVPLFMLLASVVHDEVSFLLIFVHAWMKTRLHAAVLVQLSDRKDAKGYLYSYSNHSILMHLKGSLFVFHIAGAETTGNTLRSHFWERRVRQSEFPIPEKIRQENVRIHILQLLHH